MVVCSTTTGHHGRNPWAFQRADERQTSSGAYKLHGSNRTQETTVIGHGTGWTEIATMNEIWTQAGENNESKTTWKLLIDERIFWMPAIISILLNFTEMTGYGSRLFLAQWRQSSIVLKMPIRPSVQHQAVSIFFFFFFFLRTFTTNRPGTESTSLWAVYSLMDKTNIPH